MIDKTIYCTWIFDNFHMNRYHIICFRDEKLDRARALEQNIVQSFLCRILPENCILCTNFLNLQSSDHVYLCLR